VKGESGAQTKRGAVPPIGITCLRMGRASNWGWLNGRLVALDYSALALSPLPPSKVDDSALCHYLPRQTNPMASNLRLRSAGMASRFRR
jgi:hypothetical protein